ncbi:ABC transporter substrate-binding protein [Actinopolymorpha alba]|uniref:ABC transporter substrate-binding protein n=1 Tax=Actinopolymorpha alba TaxID=533267 RepID=UPI0003A27088|nr:ABC transporter substrate-binding protein [Actinopolymorpha alba]
MRNPAGFDRRRFLAGTTWMGAALAVPALASCGGKSEPETPSQLASAKVPEKLRAEAEALTDKSASILSQKQYFAEANKAIDRALKVFSQQTGTSIRNAEVNPDEGNFVAKQDAAVKAGNVQEMAFVTAGRFVAQLHELGDIVDVSDVVQELQDQYGPAGGTASRSLQIDGKWWGIPFYTIGGGWFVRKDWLEEKGIKQEDLKTFENARDIALEISDPAQNRYGWGVTVNRGGDANGFIQTVINSYGGAITADDGRKVVFRSPEALEAINFIADMFTNPKYKKMFPPGIMSWTDTGNNEAWLAGLIGITSNQYSLYAQSKATKNPVYDKTLPLEGFLGPATDVVLNTADLNAFVIFKGAKNPDLAKILAKYLIAGDAFLGLAKDSGGLTFPAYEKVWTSDPFYLEGDPIFKVAHTVSTKKLPLRTRTGYTFPQAASAGQNAVLQAYILTDMMGEIVQKRVGVKEAVDTANKRIIQTFEQLGIKQ